MLINDDLKALADIFYKNGFSLYLVGGAVRDYILNIKNDDYDFTTDAKPEEVISLFKGKTIPTGIKHGTVTVLFKSAAYEITTFRTEGDYSDLRHPDYVSFTRSLDTDLERRDFTINAFALNILNNEIIDLHHGKEDLESRTIRAINDPHTRFSEDALRMLRACRFASKLDFDIEENTFNAIRVLKKNILKVSSERIKDEVFKIIDSKNPIKGFNLLKDSGLLELVMPELYECIGIKQLKNHKDVDVFSHSLLSLEYAKNHNYSLIVKITALLHDIGKVKTQNGNEKDGYTFYNHEIFGSDLAQEILKRLKCSNYEIETVSHLIKEHMFNYSSSWTDSAIRRFIIRVGKENIDNLFCIRYCDMFAIDKQASPSLLIEFYSRIQKELNKEIALSIKDLKINGNELMKLNIFSKNIGNCLNYLLDLVLDNPDLNENEILINLAKEWSKLA